MVARLLGLVIGCLGGAIAVAQSPEFRCVRAFPEMNEKYPRLVCEGNELLERGNPQKALEVFQTAAAFKFFESPNFLIYYRIATAQCKLQDKKAANDMMAQFETMLALYVGERSCQDATVSSSLAAKVMCSEAYDPDSYAAPKGRSIRRSIVQAYQQKLRALRKTC